jgi:hypothetical protein
VLSRQQPGSDCIQYQHDLNELARKPQAVRPVAPDFMKEWGEPFQHLWNLLEESHGGKPAGRVMAKVIQAIVDHSLDEVRESVQSCLKAKRVDRLPLLLPKDQPPEPTNAVPEALQGFGIEQASASDYNHLLQGGGS